MTVTPLREAELRGWLRSVVEKNLRGKRFVAIRHPGPWLGPPELRIGDQTYDVAVTRSALEVRQELARARPADRGVVVLTDRSDTDLGQDVLVRLAKERVNTLVPWESVKQLFKAHSIDPAIQGRDSEWMARELLEAAPVDGFDPVASGMLDEDTAWQAIAKHRIRFAERRLSLSTLLQWTTQPGVGPLFAAASPPFRRAFLARCERVLGGGGRLLAVILDAGRVAESVAIGLACDVIFSEGFVGLAPREIAVARLEASLGNTTVDPMAGRRLAAASIDVVRVLRATPNAIVEPILASAEEWLDKLKIRDHAWRSSVLPAGFDQRRERLGEEIVSLLAGDSQIDAVDRAAELCCEHDRAGQRTSDREAILMAGRLTRFVGATRKAEPTGLIDLARRYANESLFVDLARDSLRRSVSQPKRWVNAAVELLAGADRYRGEENQRFATALAEVERTSTSLAAGVLRIENVLDAVVVPIASLRPVLMLVVDGMSLPVLEQLARGMRGYGLHELRAESTPGRLLALAAYPTTTECSRASLLSGALECGGEDLERSRFESHPGLTATCKKSLAPRLIHKNGLKGESGVGLAGSVREEIANGGRRVLGIVLNAVDDDLAKGDQMREEWRIDTITSLPEILDAAREGGRVVIMTSDHGHVLEHGQTQRTPADGGARWRPGTGKLAEGEILLQGPRVAKKFGGAVILPWSENLRYGQRQNGYHGGCSTQEVIVPIAVFTTLDVEPDLKAIGWSLAPPNTPSWWESTEIPVVTGEEPQEIVEKSPPKGSLFDNRMPSGSLSDRLIASELYARQKQLVSRAALSDEMVKAIVDALMAHGGTMTRTALARKLNLAEVRVNGYLAIVTRVLNVDGFDILGSDAGGDGVRLNHEALEAQFQV